MENGTSNSAVKTRVLPIPRETATLGHFEDPSTLEKWVLPAEGIPALEEAASHLLSTSIPVAFPTETVYGLGADATRSAAVKGIYSAKGRPSDNPLIIHVCDLTMLRSLLAPKDNSSEPRSDEEVIPYIYLPLIKKFWPGPLTILLPNPQPSHLAAEVTAGLPTFGARMPSSKLALSLISLAGVPLAAPSANASTKPSPTTASHVLHDLDGRIEIILDGGACSVGVESTVVDGLCSPPVVLRPGGVSLENIRECTGWEDVVKGYKDASEIGSHAPRAPGMKYKHYSPKAKVILYESSHPRIEDLDGECLRDAGEKIGIIRTKNWLAVAGLARSANQSSEAYVVEEGPLEDKQILQISLGTDTKAIAHGLFSALRDLDGRKVEVILVEGIDDEEDIAAAVMNRLRKAATHIKTS
ncbi:translation initiation protein sua5 [Phlyctema vagabunda]|uniref:Threonylcarbamoyl-AMP synthase n=1 Tax=Phlyctema vagabunda TaxID=108571 RepID=A0ABR4P7C6_9HELO